MTKVDINIRSADEDTRKRLNVLKVSHDAGSQREILRKLIEFAEQNEDQFVREVINTDRNRKYQP